MTHLLKIQIQDETFAALVREAQAKQSTPDAVANESIDADLAREYGSTHED